MTTHRTWTSTWTKQDFHSLLRGFTNKHLRRLVSETTIQRACGGFAALVYPHDDDDDDRIRCSLFLLLGLIHGVISQDQQCRRRLANSDEYQNNVKHFGEDRFFQLPWQGFCHPHNSRSRHSRGIYCFASRAMVVGIKGWHT